ncbi:hypothetical protein Micbo1qcDRAFT_206741 [Microdochium bolleyi]|uniref:Uncharacterized protein n=1 Tax=Microdochium bolleyi TaxID=196109 RepID=A0A136IWA7_9PEZI|nr:hypothetical protein Micbo1qcDRAFT_206741 [Microdochium bolleyi]
MVTTDIGGASFDIMGTPSVHILGGGGDTVYIPELLRAGRMFNIIVAIVSLAGVTTDWQEPPQGTAAGSSRN